MSTVTDPHARLGFISAVLIAGSIGAWLVHGLLASPALYAMSQTHPVALGFAILGIFGYGVWYSYQILFEEEREELEQYQETYLELGWLVQMAITIFNIVYLNIVIVFAVIVGLYLATLTSVSVGAMFALLYPVYDMWIVRKGYPTSIAGIFAIILVVALAVTEVRKEGSWKSIHFEELLYRFIGHGPGRSLN